VVPLPRDALSDRAWRRPAPTAYRSESTFGLRVTRTRTRRLVQSMRNRLEPTASEEPPSRQRGLPAIPHWPDPQRAAGAATPRDGVCLSKFYTASSPAGTGWGSAVFAHEFSARSAGQPRALARGRDLAGAHCCSCRWEADRGRCAGYCDRERLGRLMPDSAIVLRDGWKRGSGLLGPISIEVDAEWIRDLLANYSPLSKRGRKLRRMLRVREEHARVLADRGASDLGSLVVEREEDRAGA
jgi:hypothetical protein